MSKKYQAKKSMPQSISEQPIQNSVLFELQKKYRHDAFCKDNLRNLRKAKKFLKYLFKSEVQELIDIDALLLDPDSFVDDELKRSYADVVYRIPIKNSNENLVVFVLIELKTESDKWTIFQLAKYVVRIWEQELKKAKKKKLLDKFLFPMVIPVIFHHGEQYFTAPTELIKLVRVLRGLESFVLNMKSMLFDVMAIDPKDMPKDIELSVLFMVLQAVFSTNVVDRLMAVYRKLRPTLHLPESKKEWQDALYYAAISAKRFTRSDISIVTKQIEKGEIKTMSALYEIAAESKAEGKAEGKAEATLAILRKKFKKVPKRIEMVINKMSDPIALESLVVHAAMSQTLKEFAEALS